MTFTPKTATIGGTINLGNYDNFRFEFGAEIASAEDYLGLVEFSAASLIGQFRNADETTQAAVRTYVARLCSIDEAQVPVLGQPAPRSPRKEDPAIYESTKDPYLPRQEAPVKSTLATSTTLAQVSPPPPPRPAAPAPGEEVCEKCGGGVPKSQAKLSQLFMNKTLCKRCMEAP